MDCPRCGNKNKITATEQINFAQCWKCGARWSGTDTGAGNWANRAIEWAAEKCQEYLAESTATRQWLCGKRKLPDDLGWLRAHDLGALPKFLGLGKFAKSLESDLDELAERSLESASREEREILKLEFEVQKDDLKRFSTTAAKLDDPMWADSVVYIYRDANGLPVSLNVRQHLRETGDGTKYCFRAQPTLGHRGVFCPITEAGGAWGGDCPRSLLRESTTGSVCCARQMSGTKGVTLH